MDFCSVADRDCLAPAGYRVGGNGGGVATGDRKTRAVCHQCGEPACIRCSRLRLRFTYDPSGERIQRRRVRLCLDCLEGAR